MANKKIRSILVVNDDRTLLPKASSVDAVLDRIRKQMSGVCPGDRPLVTQHHPSASVAPRSRSRMEQIIVDIAANAMAALPKGAQLMVETGETSLVEEDVQPDCTVSRLHPYTMLTIHYSGLAGNPEALDRIFEPFFTYAIPRGKKSVGLTRAYNAVLENDGRIVVSGEFVGDATFKIYLPKVRAAARS
ncbi:MAG: hypothetical protein HYW49_03950 [Deltaproteobacteria bacterium]|nr:hypothetical protein [Deltaproteobacteria bacterium]